MVWTPCSNFVKKQYNIVATVTPHAAPASVRSPLNVSHAGPKTTYTTAHASQTVLLDFLNKPTWICSVAIYVRIVTLVVVVALDPVPISVSAVLEPFIIKTDTVCRIALETHSIMRTLVWLAQISAFHVLIPAALGLNNYY